MLVAQSRPRNLKWFHAGPLLFGDWGTSRLYVLGLAFYYTAHASVLYLTAMSLIMIGAAWAYTIVCRCFPDGGGVYTAARRINPTLAVIGATLLLCDYIVTASLSSIEAFHYLGASHKYVIYLAVGTMFIVGIVNWLGSRRAGQLALWIAVAAIALSAVLAVLCLPYLPKGFASITDGHETLQSPWARWESLVRIVLALAGLEAVANMTGLMQQPVKRTAKRTIWPVCIEVIVLNLIFGIALNAMPVLHEQVKPDYIKYEVVQGMAPENVPAEVKEYRDTAMKVIAEHTAASAFNSPQAGRIFAAASGIIFGLLLLSAVNTAIMAMVSVKYSLAQDKELPHALTRLNYSGVPWVGLIIACILPAGLLLFEADVKALGELYAIGVVGAIAINFTCLAYNKTLEIGRWERRGLWFLGGLMVIIEITIVIAKPNAAIFAGMMIAIVLIIRFLLRTFAKKPEALPEPDTGWLALLKPEPLSASASGARIMLAARGRDQAEYAVELARKRKASLFAVYVRTLRLLDIEPGRIPRIEDDKEAQEALGTAALLARQNNIPFVPIYVSSPDVAAEILDYTVTFGCDTLILGKSRRSGLARAVAGDVISQVSDALPEGVTLITRAPGPIQTLLDSVFDREPEPPRDAGRGAAG